MRNQSIVGVCLLSILRKAQPETCATSCSVVIIFPHCRGCVCAEQIIMQGHFVENGVIFCHIRECLSGLIARVTVISDVCPRERDSNRPWKSEPSLNRIIGDWATRNETVFALHQPPVEFLSHFPLAFYTTKQRNVFPPIFLSPS